MINPQWLELLMSRTNFHGLKDVRAIEVRLYIGGNLGALFRIRQQMWKVDTATNVEGGSKLMCFLIVLRFYGPVNPMGSCRPRSVYLTTHLLNRLRPLSG